MWFETIDWESVQAQWLVNCWVPGGHGPGLVDLVSQEVAVPQDYANEVRFRGMKHDQIGFEWVQAHPDVSAIDLIGDHKFVPSGQVTVVLEYEKVDATNRTTAAFGVRDSVTAAKKCGAHVPYSDGIVYWDFGGHTDGTSRETYSGGTFGHDLWIFTAGPRGMEIWQNGFLRASHGNSATRTTTGGQAWTLGHSFGFGADFARVFQLRLYDRQLPQPLCRHISVRSNWHDLFGWSDRRVALEPPAPAAGRTTRNRHGTHLGALHGQHLQQGWHP